MNTNWIDQDHEWEEGAKRFAAGLLDDVELGGYAERLAEQGDRASLALTLLKLTSPGVPDIYQGDELPFLALVDPDNRRPVDWELRRRLLASARAAGEARPDQSRPRPPRAPAGGVRLDVRARRGRGRTCARSCAAARCSSPSRCAATSRRSSRRAAPGTTSSGRHTCCWPNAPSNRLLLGTVSARHCAAQRPPSLVTDCYLASSAGRRARAGRRRRPAGRTASRRSAPAGAAPRPKAARGGRAGRWSSRGRHRTRR